MRTKKGPRQEISIILPIYNSAEFISPVLDSILGQTYSLENSEVIAVDDNSTDESLTYLKKYQKQYPSLIKIIEHKVNQGRARARNSGIKQAKGGVVIFLDSDIAMHEEYIERALDFIQKPNVKGLLGKILPGREVKLENYNKYQKYLYEAQRGAMQSDSAQPVAYPHFLFSITTVDREAIDSVGLMDEKLSRHGGEDTEYAFRMAEQFQGQLYFNPELKGYHLDYIPFSQALERMKDYGKYNVPYIVQKHPKMKELYFYDYHKGVNLYKKIIGKLVKTDLFFETMYKLYQLVPPSFVFGIIKLLFGSALLRGIEEGSDSD